MFEEGGGQDPPVDDGSGENKMEALMKLLV